MQRVMVQLVPCLQPGQPRRWCRNNFAAVTHASRWESTVTSSTISSGMPLRIGQHASKSLRCISSTVVKRLLVVKLQNKPLGMRSFGRGGGDRKQRRSGFQGLKRNAKEC